MKRGLKTFLKVLGALVSIAILIVVIIAIAKPSLLELEKSSVQVTPVELTPCQQDPGYTEKLERKTCPRGQTLNNEGRCKRDATNAEIDAKACRNGEEYRVRKDGRSICVSNETLYAVPYPDMVCNNNRSTTAGVCFCNSSA